MLIFLGYFFVYVVVDDVEVDDDAAEELDICSSWF